MRVLVQRAKDAKCIVEGKEVSKIDYGYLLLVGFTQGDDLNIIKKMVKKIVNLRIFEDENEKMNLNIKQVKGKIMAISQFTLYGSCADGNRPSFTSALAYKDASKLYLEFISLLKEEAEVAQGVFGAQMEIQFTNFGPCTIAIEL